MAAVRSSTCSGLILSLYSMCTGLVAMNRWMRGSAACLTASHAQSMSFSVERASEATVQSLTAPAMVLTDSKSPGGGDGEAGLDDVHLQALKTLGDLDLLL